MTLTDLRDKLLTITSKVHHYDGTGQIGNYIVWAEDSETGLFADNAVQEKVTSGTIDYFTKTEYDPVADQIETALDDLEIAWDKISIQYETDTEYIHHEWAWEFG